MKYCPFLLLALITGFSSCKPFYKDSAKIRPPSGPQIAFATFVAVKQTDNTCTIELIEYHLIEGSIKKPATQPLLFPVDIEILNTGQKAISHFRIEHPLIEDYETANDLGQLQRMTRMRDSARFYMRFNAIPAMESIRFQSNSPDIPVIKTTIKLKK